MSSFDPERITFFAKTAARGQQIPFGIKAKDRQRHMYVIGKTGMGKSTLLENMAAQDIQNGEGMAFIDPHGSAIEVLLEYIPEDRLDDVVYFAPFDMENPVAFNIMEDVGIDTRHLVVSGLMSTFKKIWEDAWSARMEYILTNALLALIEYPDTTLLSVNRMLADKEYRDKVIENVKDPAVKAYWIDEFNNYTERFAAEALPAIQNKIGQFTGNPLIRNIIGQPKSSFDVRKMMDEKKILLINLSKGLVGETNADLIGSMLITKIYLAAMSRAELPPAQMKQMPNFYFYVDEFQSFANSTFANILSEARKYHLNLIIAHQYVAQMEDKIRDAVFGNVGTTVAFRTGPFDAEVLETVFAPQFEAVDLVNLGFAEICLTLMIDGVGSTPFSAVTLPPVQTPSVSHKHMVIKRSQQNYSRPRSEVEQVVIDSHAPEERLEAAAENGHGNKGGFTKPSGFFKVGTDKDFVKQKEQLKNGGSIKRGPAQTPPGTQSQNKPAQKTEQKNNKPTTEQKPRQKKPTEKTAGDLRAILAGMAPEKRVAGKPDEKTSEKPKQAERPKAEGALSKPQEEKSRESSHRNEKSDGQKRDNQRDQSSYKKLDRKPDKKEVEVAAVEEPNKQDLKSALAALASQPDVQTKSEARGDQNNEPQAERVADVPSEKKKNLPVDQRSESVPKQKTPREIRQERARQESSDADKSQLSVPLEAPVSRRYEQPALKGVPEEIQQEVKQSPQSAIGGVRQPAFSPVEPEELPDIAKVKQMLKTSGKERPPGIV